jgi:translation initiation factor IF-3
VRVLDETRQQLGVMPLSDALRLAYSKGLDLIEIAPEATPPVCRILEYGKFQYEEAKKKKETHGRQPGGRTKELQLTPGIDPHDFAVKLNHAIEFLCEGMKVRIKLRFRGRQRAHKEFGFEVVNKFIKETARYGHADSPPKMLGDRDLSVMITPLPREKRGKAPRGPIPSIGPVDPPAANPTGTVL